MNPQQRRYADRIRALIEQAQRIAALERPAEKVGSFIQDGVQLQEWATKVRSIVEVTFGTNGAHFRQFQRLSDSLLQHAYEIRALEGFLRGALSDLEDGFLMSQEILIAGAIFESLIEEARVLQKAGHHQAAAVLSRVALEGAIRKIADTERVANAEDAKASILNDELKKSGRFNQPRWRQIQVWLDVGNAAAHSNNVSDPRAVSEMIAGVEAFMADELK